MSLVIALLGALRASLRARTDLAFENLALRQQLVLLRRSKRPQFGRLDRLFWVWLSDQWTGWREALHVVRPQTVIRWHRQGFRAFWTWKSRRGRAGRPRVISELAELLRTMALANPLWGSSRIHRVLLKLLDADEGRWLYRHIAVGLELLAVFPVLGPPTEQAEVLPELHAEEVADDGDEVFVARDGQPHHAPGVLLVDVGDALMDALQGGRVRAGTCAWARPVGPWYREFPRPQTAMGCPLSSTK